MSPRALSELDQRDRRRALARTARHIVLVWVVVTVAYAVMPGRHLHGLGAFMQLGIAVVAVVAAMAWQTRRISRAQFPELRAIEALGTLAIIFLSVFAAVYLSLSNSTAGSFSEQLNHVSAMYFTVTVFSTVGFGDIVAKTQPARAIVTAQMLLDLVFVGVVVRLLITVARRSLASAGEEPVLEADTAPQLPSDPPPVE